MVARDGWREIGKMETAPPPTVIACYREFAPHPALLSSVRALFSWTPRAEEGPAHRVVTREVLFRAGDLFASPLLADGHSSLVFELALTCDASGLWTPRSAAPRG